MKQIGRSIFVTCTMCCINCALNLTVSNKHKNAIVFFLLRHLMRETGKYHILSCSNMKKKRNMCNHVRLLQIMFVLDLERANVAKYLKLLCHWYFAICLDSFSRIHYPNRVEHVKCIVRSTFLFFTSTNRQQSIYKTKASGV